MNAAKVVVKTVQALVNGRGEVIGECLYVGKVTRLSNFTDGDMFIEDDEGASIFGVEKSLLTKEDLVEVTKLVDRLYLKRTIG